MRCQVIVLNGGSSSGKTGLGRRLQAVLPQPWLLFGVDTLVDALPDALRGEQGIELRPDGSVVVNPGFAAVDAAWGHAMAEPARRGVRLIIDEVFVSGPSSQARRREAPAGLPVGWVGVRCDPAVAAAREAARGDRVTGMAREQAELVHRGVDHDLVVDTSAVTIDAAAEAVVAGLGLRDSDTTDSPGIGTGSPGGTSR